VHVDPDVSFPFDEDRSSLDGFVPYYLDAAEAALAKEEQGMTDCSICERCERPWLFVVEHETLYSFDENGGSGVFPLCEACCSELDSPEARLPYYRLMYEGWCQELRECPTGDLAYLQMLATCWPLIEQAVLAGG